MRTLFHKALRDLRGERVRSLSIVLALALGIAGFFAVLSAYAILTRALRDGYLATHPASATLRVARLGDDDVRSVEALPGIAGAEARRTVRGRIRSGPAKWKNLILFARRDFAASSIGTVARQSGAWPQGAGELGIERDALQVAHARVGDTVSVRTDAGRPSTLRIIGSIHDVGQAQARMENLVYGYVTLDALAALGEEPYYDQLVIRVAQDPLDEAHIQSVARVVAAHLEQRGQRVQRIDVPEPGEHPHGRIMGLLMLSLAVFGFFILVLSGVLVFNVLTALLAGQLRQIGVMKAVGGSRVQIAGVYLLEAGLLGAAAIGAALPFGLLGGRWLCRALAVFLNFDIASHTVPLWIYALVFVVGIAVPVVAALLPVWLGTRVPVREALAVGGPADRPFGTSSLDRALARVRGSSRVLLLALRNVGRHRLRVGLTLVTLTAGGIFFMAALNVRQSLVRTVDRFYAAARADLSVRLAAPFSRSTVEQLAGRIPAVQAAEGWIVADGKLGDGDDERPRHRLTVIGLPPRSRLLTFDLMRGDGQLADARRVVVNTALHDRLNRPPLEAAVRLRIEGKQVELRLAGVSREPFTPPVAYVSREFFADRSSADTVNSLGLVLSATGGDAVEQIKAQLETHLESAGIAVVQATTKTESRYSFDQHMVMIYVFLIIVSCILAAIGVLGLMTTVSLNVSERRREIGVLRALGATPGRVAQIVIIEGLVVGLLAWLVATLAVVPLTKVIGDQILRRMLSSGTEITLGFEPAGCAIWLAVTLAGSTLASLWPARQASRVSVHEALLHE
ncbi:MAG: FtsX-like permease family protein [Polyangia bacterium]